jgi:hypothetical protein
VSTQLILTFQTLSNGERHEKSESAYPDQCHPFFAHFRYHRNDPRHNARVENFHSVQRWLFWAGAIFISIGFVNIQGMFYQRTVSGLQYSQSAIHLDAAERYKIWEADILHGYNLLAFLGTSGLLLFGLAGGLF